MILTACGITNPNGKAILDFTSISGAKWIGLPPFQMCKFDITSILVMAPIAIATMMEHIGDISAISATVDENFIEDPGLHRTLIGDGLATALSAFVGGPANTTYGENISQYASGYGYTYTESDFQYDDAGGESGKWHSRYPAGYCRSVLL